LALATFAIFRPVVVPGKGIAACQAAIDTTRKNQQTVQAELGKGTDPSKILDLLKLQDTAIESRQFGILDLQGKSVGFSGRGNQANALSEFGKADSSLYYQMQGNILANDDVIHDAGRAFTRTSGTLADRVMSAMEAADARGGDRRCTDGRTAYVAYILIVDKSGKETYITATDEDSPEPDSRTPHAIHRRVSEVMAIRDDQFWASFLGIEPSDWNLPGISIRAHVGLMGYRGLWCFRHRDRVAVSAPAGWVSHLQSSLSDGEVNRVLEQAFLQTYSATK
jgi:uncharacterized Ntn-hydrolase superfamily protein